VRTRDVWSTTPRFSFTHRGGLTDWSAGVRERNLLGWGKDLMVMAQHGEQGTYAYLAYGDRQFLGRPLHFAAVLSHGADVDGVNLQLDRPRDRVTVGWAQKSEVHRYRGPTVDHRGGLDGPEYRSDYRRVTIYGGPRLARSGARAAWVMPAVHAHDATHTPAADRAGWKDDGNGLGGRGDLERLRDIRLRVVGVAIGYMEERFTVWSRLETLRRWEDVNLGADLWLLAGYAGRALGADRDAVYGEWSGRRGIRLGGRAYVLFDARGTGQLARGRLTEARLSLGAKLLQGLSGRQALAACLLGERTHDLAPQSLPTLGAESGLRGYDAYRFWGEQAVKANLEHRLMLVEDWFGLVSIGTAEFVDGGMAWTVGEDRRARPRAAAGVGLRLQGSRTASNVVTRIDLGRPIAGGAPGDDWVISVAAGQAF
jgi:hypothetical protein